MTQKRPKITVTESNREFVLPTLEKLGGINGYGFTSHRTAMEEGEIYIIKDNKNIELYWDISYFNRSENINDFYEVDPKDYVGVKSDPSELDQLKAENEKLRENQIPESLRDFISDVKWMIKCYQSQRYTMAENKRDSFIEVLDDLMRLPKEKTTDF